MGDELQNYFTNADRKRLGMTDKPIKEKAKFKPVNVAETDWEEYNQAAIALSAERGERVSIPALLKEAYNNYLKTL